MTLEEAIKHAEEVMVENLEKTKDRNASDPIAINCFECADEHRQLAEWLKDYKRLLEQEPCEDAISRQACLYVLTGGDVEKQFPKINEALKKIINSIPPLKPAEPQTGHWKKIGHDIYECSICGQDVMTGDICAYRHCHCCGTRMER